MKGRIELGEFIMQVKAELMAANSKDSEPFYSLDAVELEVAFTMETTGKSKGRLVVLELEGEAKASQVHKVTLKLTPLSPARSSGTGSGGGGGLSRLEEKICYAPVDTKLSHG
ncbi:MAG: trypco2 family protein [Gammaproteobacteria bacterium]